MTGPLDDDTVWLLTGADIELSRMLYFRGDREDVPALGEGHDLAARACTIVVFAVGLWDRPVDMADLRARAEKVIGHQFTDADLLIRSLTHSSVADSRLQSNERLEFLGDAILGMVVCEELFHRFDDWLEGDLTKVKSAVVSRRVCADIADKAGLTELLILGNGIEAQDKLPVSVRAAVLEAIIGAVYLDGGLLVARRFILDAISSAIEEFAASEDMQNYKSVLQHYTQRWLSAAPSYAVLDEQGPDHAKCFEVCVVIQGKRYPSAWGPSKKQAEQEAAHRALRMLQDQRESPDGPDT